MLKNYENKDAHPLLHEERLTLPVNDALWEALLRKAMWEYRDIREVAIRILEKELLAEDK